MTHDQLAKEAAEAEAQNAGPGHDSDPAEWSPQASVFAQWIPISESTALLEAAAKEAKELRQEMYNHFCDALDALYQFQPGGRSAEYMMNRALCGLRAACKLHEDDCKAQAAAPRKGGT